VFRNQRRPQERRAGDQLLGNSEYSDNDLRDVVVTKEAAGTSF
jgi:hypothetical protein